MSTTSSKRQKINPVPYLHLLGQPVLVGVGVCAPLVIREAHQGRLGADSHDAPVQVLHTYAPAAVLGAEGEGLGR